MHWGCTLPTRPLLPRLKTGVSHRACRFTTRLGPGPTAAHTARLNNRALPWEVGSPTPGLEYPHWLGGPATGAALPQSNRSPRHSNHRRLHQVRVGGGLPAPGKGRGSVTPTQPGLGPLRGELRHFLPSPPGASSHHRAPQLVQLSLLLRLTTFPPHVQGLCFIATLTINSLTLVLTEQKLFSPILLVRKKFLAGEFL